MTQVSAFPYANPPRAEVLVAGSSAVRLNVYRLVGDSAPVLVRGAIRLVVTDPLVVVDYEAPVGVPVVYSAQELDALGQPVANVPSAPVTVVDEGTWLSQPLYPERVVKVEQLRGSFVERSTETFGEHVRVGGRDLGVWMGSGRGGVRGGLSFVVQSEADRAVVESMFGLRGEQIPPVLCLRSTLAQRLPQPLYIAVPKPSQRGVNWHMQGDLTVFEWDVEETSAPSPAIVVPGYTYLDLEAAYSGAIITNYSSNPSAASSATGTFSSYRAATRVATAGAYGTGFFRGTAVSGDANSLLYQDFAVVPGMPYSGRVAAKSPQIAGQQVRASIGFFSTTSGDGGFISQVTAPAGSLSTAWRDMPIENAIAPAGAVRARLQGLVLTSAGAAYAPTAGQQLDADGFMFIDGPVALPYADGSSAGWEWLGTAGLSQSYMTANTYRQLELDHQTYSDIERRYDLGGLG